ncbi:TraB/GumN family protein [Oceanisphaera sp. W20_SRM_FM3]|uniref:TraB/GumN family protein n=1 Tax=Oceanisphaera sp. W20_SRM_FM3 TaxID=3240267 RepID=UPI003F9D64A4
MKIFSFLLLWLYSGYGLSAPALWSAIKGDQQLWLFGSIHLADARLAKLPTALAERLQRSEHLYLEVNPKTVTPQLLTPFLTLPAADSWQTRLGSPLSLELEHALAALNLSHLKSMPPWFATMQLSQAHAKLQGFVSNQGVDMQLLQLAEQQGFTVSALESPTLVFELMASLSERNLEQDFVRHSLTEQAEMAEHLELLFSTWQSGDERALLALLDDQGSPALTNFIRQELLWARNKLWLAELKRQAPTQALIVVGALHLYGEQGLLELLQADGYQLQKVRDKTTKTKNEKPQIKIAAN